MSLTPHGPGFSFLDAFEVTEPARRGKGRKRLDPKMTFFADHFPGEPLMPGVLLIEAAAQAAGALWASMREEGEARHFTLAQIVQFKILRPVLPGEMLESDVSLDHLLGSLAQFSVALTVKENEVARGKLVLSAKSSLP
jgi:3-hydroxyacyl-[acyl-carrier-protein] dehydratase